MIFSVCQLINIYTFLLYFFCFILNFLSLKAREKNQNKKPQNYKYCMGIPKTLSKEKANKLKKILETPRGAHKLP